MSEVIVRFSVDQGPLAPHEECDGAWTPYSFSTKHSNFKHPDEFRLGRDGMSKDKELAHKLD
ncbi:hypothetical protein LCGC14_3036900, partial [marine sediment metagenome]